PHGVERFVGVVADESPAVPIGDLAGDLGDVAPVISVGRKLDGLAEVLLVPRPNAAGQARDLLPRIIVVELAVGLPPIPLEELSDRVAERGLAAVADVEGTRRVGGNELHHDGLSTAGVRPAIVVRTPDDLREPLTNVIFGEAKVDEAGAGDLHRRDACPREIEPGGELLGDLPWGAPKGSGQRHRDVAGQIPVRGVARSLQDDLFRPLDSHLLENTGDLESQPFYRHRIIRSDHCRGAALRLPPIESGGAARTDAAAAGAATPSGRCSGWWFNRPEIFVQSLVELDFASEPLDLLELLDFALSEPPFSEPAAFL